MRYTNTPNQSHKIHNRKKKRFKLGHPRFKYKTWKLQLICFLSITQILKKEHLADICGITIRLKIKEQKANGIDCSPHLSSLHFIFKEELKFSKW